jgi:hypothetical protein
MDHQSSRWRALLASLLIAIVVFQLLSTRANIARMSGLTSEENRPPGAAGRLLREEKTPLGTVALASTINQELGRPRGDP